MTSPSHVVESELVPPGDDRSGGDEVVPARRRINRQSVKHRNRQRLKSFAARDERSWWADDCWGVVAAGFHRSGADSWTLPDEIPLELASPSVTVPLMGTATAREAGAAAVGWFLLCAVLFDGRRCDSVIR
jgi:hypothetical protein